MLENQLQLLIDKEEIVKTQSANDIINNPDKVQEYYKVHVYTHISLGGVEEFEHRLFENLKSNKSCIGCVIAKYGYGKTSTLIDWWSKCEKSGFIAIPPFNFTSLMDIANATYGWVGYKFTISGQNDLLVQLKNHYDDVTVKSKETLKKKHGLTDKQVIEMTEEGTLNVEVSSFDLKTFIDQVVSLVLRSKHKGLVIFADEFQIFTTKERGVDTRKILQSFREYLDGIKTLGDIPFGFIIAIPQESISYIMELRRDIIERLEQDRIKVNLGSVFDREFPINLWEKLAKELKFDDNRKDIISEDVLRSLGQIVVISELDAGPRTIISSFRLASQYYLKTKKQYDLTMHVDNFLQSINPYISTDYVSITNRVLGLKNEIDSEDKQNVIKILAAFPEGVKEDFFEKKGLYDVFLKLHQKLQGEYIIWIAEGYSLPFKLEKISEDDQILKEFWRRYSPQEFQVKEIATEVFIQEIVPNLFQEHRGQFMDWGGVKAIENQGDPINGYQGKLSGTFSEEFPRRELWLKVINDEKKMKGSSSMGCDIALTFLLNENSLIEIEGNSVAVKLDLDKTYAGDKLPPSIAKLQKMYLPKEICPKLLLNLVNYLSEHSLKKGKLEYLRTECINQSILLLFNGELAASSNEAGLGVKSNGKILLEELYLSVCKKFWPHYKTLMISEQWRKHLQRYCGVLDKLPIPQKRDGAIIKNTKKKIAEELFEFSGQTYSSFEPRMKDYERANLIKFIESSGGKDIGTISIQISEHPVEKMIKEKIRKSGYISKDEIYDLAKPLGYRNDETEAIIALLECRRYMMPSEKNNVFEECKTITENEINVELSKHKNDLLKLKSSNCVTTPVYDNITKDIDEVQKELSEIVNQEDIEHIYYDRIPPIKIRISDAILGKLDLLKGESFKEEQELNILNQKIIPSELEEKIVGSIKIVQHLDDCRTELIRQYNNLKPKSILNKLTKLNQNLKTSSNISIEEGIELVNEYSGIKTNIDQLYSSKKKIDYLLGYYKDWIKNILKNAENLRESVLKTSLQNEIDDLIEEIMGQFAQRGLETLKEAEIYTKKLYEINTRKAIAEKELYKKFNDVKSEYEEVFNQKALEEIIPDRVFRIRFDPTNSEMCYEDIYSISQNKLVGAIKPFKDRLSNINKTISYYELLKNIELFKQEKNNAKKIGNDIEELQKKIEKFENIKDINVLSNIVNEIIKIKSSLETLQKEVDKNRKPEPPNKDEEEILQLIEQTNNPEFVEILQKIGEKKKKNEPIKLFEEGKEILISLYKKGLINISISLRR